MAGKEDFRVNIGMNLFLTEESDKAKKAFGDISKETDNLTKKTKNLGDQEKKNEKARDRQAVKEVKANKGRARRVAETIGMYASIGTAIYATIGAIKDTVTEYLKLDKTLHQIKAITSSSAASIKALGTEIRTTSASIAKSIGDVGKYAVAMSKLGLSVTDIVTVTESVATLSAVLGEGLAETGTLVVTTLKQFNLEMEDANYVTSVFFKAIKESPLDMNKLAVSMQYVGSSAEAVGVDFKTAGEMMILLANRGLKASKIGTGLRNVFIKLKEEGVDVVDMLREMSEEGLQFSESVDLFGKRGAIVGYNLIANFGELEEMMASALPTAMDNTIAKIEATSGVLDSLSRGWSLVKASFTDWDSYAKISIDAEKRAVIAFVGELSNAEDVFDNLNEFAENGNKDGFHKLLTESLEKAGIDIKIFKDGADSLYKSLSNIYDLSSRVQYGRIAGKASVALSVDAQIGSIADQDIAVGQIQKLIDEQKAILKSTDPSVLFTRDDIGVKATISYLEKYLNKILQLNRTSEEEAINFIKTNDKAAREAFRSTKKYLKMTVEQKYKSIKAMEAIEKNWREKMCKLYPDSGYCPEKRKKREYVSVKMSKADDKTSLEKGETPDFGQFFTEANSLSETLSFVNDYYDSLVNEININEEKALKDIAANREGIKFEYLQKAELIQGKIDGTTSVKAKEVYLKKLQKLHEDYRKQDDALLDQEKDAKEAANSSLLKLEKQHLDSKKKINEEYEKDKRDSEEEKIKLEEDINKRKLRLAEDAIAALSDIYNKFNQEMLANKLESISAELEAVQRSKSLENDILKSQLDNDIITIEAYEKQVRRLDKKEIDEKNRLNKAAFEAQKSSDINAAIVSGIAQSAQAFIQAFTPYAAFPAVGIPLGVAAAGIVAAKSTFEVAAISQRTFTPVKYADGGFVHGASHSNGGVPFTVAGQGGYEMEGNEFVVNAESAKRNAPLLEAINGSNGKHGQTFFADGGSVARGNGVNRGDVNSQPQIIKAYITKRDMRNYESEEGVINNISSI